MNRNIDRIKKENQYRSKFYQEFKPKHHAEPKHHSEKKKELKIPKLAITVLNRILISAMLLFVLLIARDDSRISFIYDATFKNLNFAAVDGYLTRNFSGIFPKATNDNLYVDANVITIDNAVQYLDGVLVTTDPYEAVESHTAGIVIRMYHEDTLGNVVVIQNEKGYLYEYGCLEDVKVKLYSRVSYGQTIGIGRVNDLYEGEFYLAISNGNESLDVINVVNDEN